MSKKGMTQERRSHRLVSIVSLLLVFVILFSSCGQAAITVVETTKNKDSATTEKNPDTDHPHEDDHVHKWDFWEITKEATCTKEGEEVKTCACGEKVVQTVAAKGHSYIKSVTAPTCTEKGFTTYTCTVCLESYIDDYTKKTEHSYTSIVTAPTCTERGYTTYTCACGDSYVGSYVSSTGHTYGEWVTVTEPTCTKAGQAKRTCACGDYEIKSLAMIAHEYDAVVTSPTCTQRGYTTYTCKCGDSYVDNFIIATGHTYGAWETVKEATCTEKGEAKRTCACGDFETKSLAMIAHEYDAVVTSPTCTQRGYTTYTCACGDSYVSDYVDVTGHSYGEWETVTEPTCTNAGEAKRTCACGDVETKEIEATGHSYKAVVTEPTCEEEGYTTYTCACGDSYVSDYVDATGHSYGEWETVTEPSCTEAGEAKRTCACGDVETKEIEATCHSYGEWETVTEPSCTEAGEAKRTCACGDVETKEIEATGHSYEAVVTEPTCEEEGYTTYTCACGDSYVSDYVDATGHSYGEWETVTEPSCTEAGEAKRTCACGDVETKEIEATGHSYGEWETVTEPTCTNAGEAKRTCACGDFETKEIEATGHSYEAVVTEPTCTEDGYTTYTCECGDSYVSDYVDATGHSYGEWETVTEPSCTEVGEAKRTCACGDFETKEIEATGHSYEAVVTEPTCTEEGYTTYTCECGDSYVSDYVDATGHNYGEWETVTEATCTEVGEAKRTCACGDFETKEIEATGHSYKAVVTEPTCEEEGYTTYTCACGDSYVSDYVGATGHSYGEWEIVTEATCTEAGEAKRTCACGDFETKEIEATGHEYSAVVTEPTCEAGGYTTYTCECGDSYVSDYVDALGHTYGEWETVTEPTCTEKGEAKRTCACGDFETKEIDATGHEYSAVVTEPTCEAEGYTTYTCECGDSYVSDYVDATGHSYGEWETVTEPTCTEKGEAKRTCACGDFETKEIDATGHEYSAVVTEPTCEAEGYTTYTCECGDSYVSDYVDATGHTYGEWETVTEPTCTEKGEAKRTCACGDFETKEIDATGHEYSAVVTEPTCEDEGYTTYTCECGDSYVDGYVDATGHTYGEWETVTEPTCTEKGEAKRTCACGDFETKEIDATGHEYNAVVTEPTCEDDGYTTYTCECGDSYVGNYVGALGHLFGKWETVTDATCEEDGEAKRVCGACGETETKVLEATGHEYSAVVTLPTCEEEGYTTYTCECGDSYVGNYVGALGHLFGKWETVTDATCEEDGEAKRVCGACGETETKVLEASGHEYNAVVTLPTCEDEGYTTYTCECGDSYVGNYVDATGHKDGDGNGLCDACGESLGGSLAAGLYDANDNLIASWDELVSTYGMKADVDYTSSTYKTNKASPYYVLTNTAALQNGIKLVIGEVTKIGKYAFRDCTSLTSVEIPDSVTSIGEGAFASCRSLTSIEIPDSVTSIGYTVFTGCTSLIRVVVNANNSRYSGDGIALYNKDKSTLICVPGSLTTFVIPDSVRSIEDYAFSGCNSLASVTIGNSVRSIGDYAFSDCDSLASVTIGNSVRSIGDYAFRNCDILTSVIIPDSVTSIGNYVFRDCTSLANIEIPDSVTSIGDSAFYNCDSLTSVTIGNSVRSIGNYAFSNCDSLTSIVIPNSVTSIGSSAFSNCSNLTAIYCEAESQPKGWNARWKYSCSATVYWGNEWIYINGVPTVKGEHEHEYVAVVTAPTCTKEGYTTYTCECGDSYVGNYVGATGHKDGDGNGLCDACGERLGGSLAAGLYDANDNLIASWDELVSTYGMRVDVDYTSSNYQTATTSPYYVLTNTGALQNSVKLVIGNVDKIGDYAFYNCDSLTSVTIPDSVTLLGDYAFYSCSNLTNVTIGNGVTSIGKSAFYACLNLTRVAIPNSVTSIGDGAFQNCYKLVEVYNQSSLTITKDSTENGYIGYYAHNIYTLTSGESKRWIDEKGYIFYEDGTTCYLLGYTGNETALTLPASCHGKNYEIYKYAFWYCTSLTSVTIGNGVTSIGQGAFLHCESLTSVTIGNGVTSIGDNAFNYCTSLTSIVIPDCVMSIANFAFSNCNSLMSVTIGNGVTSIGKWAFSDCTSLMSVTIGNGVTSIGYGAFHTCTSLTSVTIGNGVTSIGSEAFLSCYKLVEVYDKSSLSITKGSTAYGYIGYYALNIYTPASGESKLWTNEDGYLFYEDGATCYLLGYTGNETALTLPASCRGKNYGIYKYAFAYFSSLTSVTIPDGVTSIGDSAFEECTSLSYTTYNNGKYLGNARNPHLALISAVNSDIQSCTIHLNTKVIADYAFYRCSRLTSIVIPDSVTSIGEEAFGICQSLMSLTIGDGVTSIGDYAFAGCEILAHMTIGNSVTSIGEGAFYSCASLTSVTIPDGVTRIGEWAFYNCASLTSVTIGNSVTSIGEWAFYNCASLTSVTIPDGVTSIDDEAFYGCVKLVEVYNKSQLLFTEGSTDYGYIGYYALNIYTPTSGKSKLWTDEAGYIFYEDGATCYLLGYTGDKTVLTLPASCHGKNYKIYQYAFYNCYRLTSVAIPNSVTSIGDNAFEFCRKLVEVYNKSSLTITKNSSHGYIGYYALNIYTPTSGKSKLWTDEEGYIFYEDGTTCYLLGYTGNKTVLTLPASCHGKNYEIYKYAFYGCISLTSVVIPNSVTSIGEIAFSWCTSLTSVTIGNGVTSIGQGAFSSCRRLVRVTIGNSVTSIGDVAFSSCISLEAVYYAGTESEWASIRIGNDHTPCFTDATRYYYSETPPTTEGNYWHYVNGVPTVWHIHGYVAVVTPPTCTEQGYTTYTCGCGDSYVGDYVDALGHLFGKWETVTDATCEEDGEAKRVCVACGETETKVLEATGHEYSAVVTEPTCEAEGYTTYTCECGDSYIGDYADAIGHLFGKWQTVTESTCETDGEAKRVCGVCGKVETKVLVAEHDYSAVVTAPTCTTEGYTTYTCECGDSYVGDYVGATGHSDISSMTHATCTKDGYTSYICLVCDRTYVSDYVMATGHDYSDWYDTVPATCETDGEQASSCFGCGITKTRPTSAIGHSYVMIEVVESEGNTSTYRCEYCEDTVVIENEGEEEDLYFDSTEQLLNQDSQFSFTVISSAGADYIYRNLSIIDAYFEGTEYVTNENVVQLYTLTASNTVENGWIVSPQTPYKGGSTFIAKLTGDLRFADYRGSKLSFSIDAEESDDFALSDDVVFLKALEEESPGYYPYSLLGVEDAEQSEYLYLILSKADGIHVGDVILVGDVSTPEEIILADEDIFFGKVDAIHLNQDGKYVCVLSCPDLSEVFDHLDINSEFLVNFEDYPEVQETLEAESLGYLYSSDEFAEFIAATDVTVQNYALERNLQATALTKANFSDMLKIDPPTVNINGTLVTLTFSGSFSNKFKDSNGKELGEFSIEFTISMEFEFEIGVNYQLTYAWIVPTGIEYFDISVTQRDKISIDFNVKFELDYDLEKGPDKYFYVKTSKKIHVSGCTYQKMTDNKNIEYIEADKLHEYAQMSGFTTCKKCQPLTHLESTSFVYNIGSAGNKSDPYTIHRYTCWHVEEQMKPENKEVFYDSYEALIAKLSAQGKVYDICSWCQPNKNVDFEQKLLQTYKYADWGDKVSQIKEWAKSSGATEYEEPNGISIGSVHCPVAYIISVNLDLRIFLTFEFEAALNYHYEQSHTNVFGMRLQNGRVEAYSNSSKSETSSYLKLSGRVEFKAGLSVDGYVSIVGLSQWIRAGFYAEVGPYLEIKGIVYLTSDTDVQNYAAAYFSTGLYMKASFYYKLFSLDGTATLMNKKYPIAALGYDKAYYSYAEDVDELEISSNTELDLDTLLAVKYYDVQEEENGNEVLSLYSHLYRVNISFANGEHCRIVDGEILIDSDAPCKFTDTIIIEVTGNTSWKNYVKGSAVVYLDTREIELVYEGDGVHSWVFVETIEPICTQGYTSYRCMLCETAKTDDYIEPRHTYSSSSDICVLCGYGVAGLYDGNDRLIATWDTLVNVYGMRVDLDYTSSSYQTRYSSPYYVLRNTAALQNGVKLVIGEVTKIGGYAFYDCGSLTSVMIPDSVTSIGSDAFGNCTSLTSVEIPDSVTSIGAWAFGYCSRLTSVTIGNGVTSIGSSAFYNCTSLTSIEIPDSVTSIGSSAFGNCDNLTSIEIPNSVTSIGREAFYKCYSLTSVTIGNSVTSIGDYTFAYCDNLTSIEIPNSVTSIGGHAFYKCYSLASVTIGNSVTSIGNSAFCECTRLTSVEIPDSVTSIGDRAFYDCDSLASVTIGNSVTSIGDSAFFDCNNLVSVTIGNSVTSIGGKAFSLCFKIVEVINKSSLAITVGSGDYGFVAYDAKEVHSGTTKIVNQNGYLFYTYNGVNFLLGYTGSDTELKLPDSYNGEAYEIYYRAFYDCTSLTSVTIGNSVTSIGGEAFYKCDSLTSVTIGDSVTSIGGEAFYDCGSLASVTIGNSVTSIGWYAFAFCDSLTSVEIPNSVTSIGDYAFAFCDSLASVTIGNSVTSIGDSAFKECYKLVEVINKSSLAITVGSSYYGDIAKYAKEVHSDTTKIVNQNGYLFYTYNGVHYLVGYVGSDTELKLPDSYNGEAYEINQYAFYDCGSLTSVTIGNSVTSIGQYAFYGCTSLVSVTTGNSVTSIGRFAFAYCNSLKNVTIGNSVKSIGANAFAYCDNLTSVIIPDSVTSFVGGAFYNCNSLTSVVIGNSVTSIGERAFEYCYSLTSVIIPDSVTSIHNYVFQYCTSLTSITFTGTTSQWKAISKGPYWKTSVPATYVQCSDGTVAL